jgi:hypothetical protein
MLLVNGTMHMIGCSNRRQITKNTLYLLSCVILTIWQSLERYDTLNAIDDKDFLYTVESSKELLCGPILLQQE